MDRRGFLKRYSLIPFIGCLSSVGLSEATESKNKEEKWELAELFKPTKKLYANIYNSKGEIIAHAMPVREVKGQYEVFMPTLESGRYTILVCEDNKKGVIWVDKICVGDKPIRLEFANPEHAKIPSAREWLDECEDILTEKIRKKMESYRSITLW